MFGGRAELAEGRAALEKALHLLHEELVAFVDRQTLRDPSKARLEAFVERYRLESKRIDQWDFSDLLKFMDYEWNKVFRDVFHPRASYVRALVIEMRHWRNEWAHPKLRKPLSAEDVDRALDSGARLLCAVDGIPVLRDRA